MRFAHPPAFTFRCGVPTLPSQFRSGEWRAYHRLGRAPPSVHNSCGVPTLRSEFGCGVPTMRSYSVVACRASFRCGVRSHSSAACLLRVRNSDVGRRSRACLVTLCSDFQRGVPTQRSQFGYGAPTTDFVHKSLALCCSVLYAKAIYCKKKVSSRCRCHRNIFHVMTCRRATVASLHFPPKIRQRHEVPQRQGTGSR